MYTCKYIRNGERFEESRKAGTKRRGRKRGINSVSRVLHNCACSYLLCPNIAFREKEKHKRGEGGGRKGGDLKFQRRV